MNLQHGSAESKFILAFDFGGTKFAIATATPSGTVLIRKEAKTHTFKTGQEVLAGAIRLGAELVRETIEAGHGQTLVGVGVSTMGITKRDRVLMAPNIPGWAELRIEESMEQAFAGIPIYIDNDVKAAAFAEVKRGALQQTDVGLYVNLGTGFAMAYTLSGRVLQGHNGASGEIAYNLRTAHEPLGAADDVAPLEEFVGGRNIAKRMAHYFDTALSAQELFRMSASNERARALAEEILREVAFHVTNAVIQWDPEIVVFGGGMIGAWDMISPCINKYLQKFVPFPPKLSTAYFGANPSLHGAIELALQSGI